MDARALPLAGVRVVDLTVVWAGPYATQLLGDLGAEVIRVENTHVWATYTRGIVAHPTPRMIEGGLAWAIGYPDRQLGKRHFNRHPSCVNMFRNKYGMTVDIRTDEGKAILRRLIESADVLFENNVPETIDKLGLDYDTVRAWNDRIVYVRVPAYGLTGPYRNYRGLGTHIEGVIGHSLLRGYPDSDPTANTLLYSGDFLAGAQGVFATLAALHARRRTGKGQLIEIAQAENGIGMFAPALMDWILNRRLHQPIGNRDLFGGAPSGVYPAKGNDRWIAITVYSDDEWRALCDEIGDSAVRDDPRFADSLSRVRHHDELDRVLAGWTAPHDMRKLARRLQARGIAAGPVLDSRDAFEDPHLRARGYFDRVSHPEFGPKNYDWPGMPFRFDDISLKVRKPPAALGEDNEYVYKTLLGYSDDEYRQFVEHGHIGTDYDDTIR